MDLKKIKTALISVYNKSHILNLAHALHQSGVTIISTGGTESFLKKHNIDVKSIDKITNYPSILGGRVKTLHPKILHEQKF